MILAAHLSLSEWTISKKKCIEAQFLCELWTTKDCIIKYWWFIPLEYMYSFLNHELQNNGSIHGFAPFKYKSSWTWSEWKWSRSVCNVHFQRGTVIIAALNPLSERIKHNSQIISICVLGLYSFLRVWQFCFTLFEDLCAELRKRGFILDVL